MSKTTADTMFYSKSTSIGSVRWAPDLPPAVVRAYVLDMKFMPSLTERWCVIALMLVEGMHRLVVAGMGSDEVCSLESEAIAKALESPTFSVSFDAHEFVAIERFERAVANVMHGRLEPTTKVLLYWQRLAHTDGTDLFKPQK